MFKIQRWISCVIYTQNYYIYIIHVGYIKRICFLIKFTKYSLFLENAITSKRLRAVRYELNNIENWLEYKIGNNKSGKCFQHRRIYYPKLVWFPNDMRAVEIKFYNVHRHFHKFPIDFPVDFLILCRKHNATRSHRNIRLRIKASFISREYAHAYVCKY